MKVLVVCYEFPPVGGGGGRIAAKCAEGLVRRGHEVRFLTGGAGILRGESEIDGVVVTRVGSPRAKLDTCTVPEMLWYILWGIFPGLRIILKMRPDVLHVHFAVPSGALGWILSVLTRVPYVLTAHLGDVPGGVPEQTAGLFRWLKPFTVPIWRGAAKTTAVSAFVSELAKEAYGAAPEVIPNGLEFLEATPAPSRKPLHFLFAGRISVQKNLLLALEALAMLPKGSAWELDVVGEGPLAREAREFCAQQGMENRVHFHGWKGPGELADISRRCEVLLMPSRHEGLPMAAVEALAGGMAIVGTNIPGLRDVVEDGVNGLLAEPIPAAFAKALEEILTDRKRLEAMKEASARKAEGFRLGRIVERYEAVLRSAKRGAGGRPAPFS